MGENQRIIAAKRVTGAIPECAFFDRTRRRCEPIDRTWPSTGKTCLSLCRVAPLSVESKVPEEIVPHGCCSITEDAIIAKCGGVRM